MGTLLPWSIQIQNPKPPNPSQFPAQNLFAFCLNFSLLPMASLFLPAGCRFFPSPQELLRDYLRPKNSSNTNPIGLDGNSLIKEVNLYEYAPFHLPEITCFRYGNGNRKMHWLCYTRKEVVENTEEWRRTEGGYWKRKGDAVDVTGFGGVLGTQTTFEFYRGNSVANAVRTRWCMYEYALPENVRASFVLCRVFNKSLAGNGASENILSSLAEESGSTVLNIYHTGNFYTNCENIYNAESIYNTEVKVTPDTAEVKVTPDTVEVKMHDDNSVDGKNAESGFPSRLNGEPYNPAMNVTVYAVSFQSPRIPSSELVISEELALKLSYIQEDDFIELDDLVM